VKQVAGFYSITDMGEENVKQPLLGRKKYYENCPGCKVDQAKELNEGQGVPIRNLVVIWILVLSSGKHFTLF